MCREWQDGLVTSLLRKLCLREVEDEQNIKTNNKKSAIKLLQLDGEVLYILYKLFWLLSIALMIGSTLRAYYV